MLGLRENVIDIPYDMISSIRIDNGVFSPNVIFKAPGLISLGRRGMLDKMMKGHELAEEEGIITAIPKHKAENLLEVIRSRMRRDKEVYRHREQPQQQSFIADELMKLANLKDKGIISDEEFQQMKQDLIKKSI
jgi:hypothetical protein